MCIILQSMAALRQIFEHKKHIYRSWNCVPLYEVPLLHHEWAELEYSEHTSKLLRGITCPIWIIRTSKHCVCMCVCVLNENTQAEIWVGPEGPVKCFLFAMPRRPWKCTVLTVVWWADACTLSNPHCVCIWCVYTCTHSPQMSREMESCPAEPSTHPLSTFLPHVLLPSLVPPAPTVALSSALNLFFQTVHEHNFLLLID